MRNYVIVAIVPIALVGLSACTGIGSGSPLASQPVQGGAAIVRVLVRSGVALNTPHGYGPSDLQQAYNLPSSTHGAG